MNGLEGPPAKKMRFDSFKPKLKKNGTASYLSKLASKVSNGHNQQNGSNNFALKKKAQSLKSSRNSLPVSKVSSDLIEQIKRSDTSVLIADTGSGKTTQVPQLIYENGLAGGRSIVVTQPRRIAAISIATRVAEEVGSELGKLVGYSVRFEDMTSEQTKIKFATDGMILRDAMLDPLLKRYSWVILDEAHERTINTDILFGIIKRAQKIRKKKNNKLNVLVMSATLNPTKFSKYFNDCPVLYTEGRGFKLDINFMPKMPDDYVLSCLKTIFQVHKTAPIDHGILVFMTGHLEIERATTAATRVLRRLKENDSRYPDMKVLPLYAALPEHKQMQVFQPTQSNERRVILSTNIAETSVTIPGIRIVIDSGKSKVRKFNPKTGFSVLAVESVSQAEAWQRAGRAGREADGTVYHTYTESHFNKMLMMPIPEINRASLTSVILQLLNIGIKDVMTFDFIDKPNTDSMVKAIEDLILLEAVKKTADGKLELTEEGKKMALFPLEPCYSKIILAGPKFSCTQEVRNQFHIIN